MDDLPLIDEHSAVSAAPPDAVWAALGRSVARLAGRPAASYARLVGCDPGRAGGDPLVPGGTVPGFACREAEPGHRWVLAGRHRFSRYVLVFRLEPVTGGTRLTAETWADFPGAWGAAYRLVVVRSGAHVLVTRRLVRGIARAAERHR